MARLIRDYILCMRNGEQESARFNEYAHYDIVWDAIVVHRADGTEESHRCGNTDSDTKLKEVWARLKSEEAGWHEEFPFLVRYINGT